MAMFIQRISPIQTLDCEFQDRLGVPRQKFHFPECCRVWPGCEFAGNGKKSKSRLL